MKFTSPLVMAILGCATLMAGPAMASTLMVLNNNDAGAGSLRQTILASGSGDTILFANAVSGTITLTSGGLAIAKNLTIQGPGANVLTIDANDSSRVFNISAGTVNVTGLTLAHGVSTSSSSGGGGDMTIAATAVVNIQNCRITGGRSGYEGGGVENLGTLTVADCTFDNNYCTNNSGGGLNSAGSVALTNCTFTANRGGYGGGLFIHGTGVVQNCTLVSNAGPGGGGGIFFNGTVTVISSLIAGNTSANGADIFDVGISGGYNLIGETNRSTGFGLAGSHDQVGTTASPINPLIGPLQFNGGTTPTMALLPGSPAIDKGKSGGLTADQRGRPRVFDFSAVTNPGGGDGSDIGAYELNPPILAITRVGSNVLLSWSTNESGYKLQTNANVTAPTGWGLLPGTPAVVAGHYTVTNTAVTGRRYYRLSNP
jgi:hypothetical protein